MDAKNISEYSPLMEQLEVIVHHLYICVTIILMYASSAPMDYTAINQTSIIPAGTTRFEITIPIQYDELHEPSETFEVHVSLPDEPIICMHYSPNH